MTWGGLLSNTLFVLFGPHSGVSSHPAQRCNTEDDDIIYPGLSPLKEICRLITTTHAMLE
jgi:hypothetical protein